jgi:chaperonin GroES
MSVQPLHDRVLVKRIEEQEVAPGGIVIPDTAKEKPQQGRIVAAGNGRRLKDGAIIPLDAHVGDRIIFGKFAGTDVVLEGEDFLILREDEIFAIVEQAAEGRKAA